MGEDGRPARTPEEILEAHGLGGDVDGGDVAPAEEAPKGPVDGASKEAPSESNRVVLKYRGKEVDVDSERAIDLAQKGFDYETKMREMKLRREELTADEKNFAEYKELQRWLREHPDAGGRITELMAHVEKHGTVPGLDLESAEADAMAGVPKSVLDDIRELKAHRRQESVQSITDRMAARFCDAIEAHPVLSRISKDSHGRYGRDLALEALVNAMPDGDPLTVDLSILADSVATQFASTNETLEQADATDSYVREKEQDRGKFKSESPGGANPPGSGPKPPSFNGKDLENGNVRRAAADFLRSRV